MSVNTLSVGGRSVLFEDFVRVCAFGQTVSLDAVTLQNVISNISHISRKVFFSHLCLWLGPNNFKICWSVAEVGISIRNVHFVVYRIFFFFFILVWNHSDADAYSQEISRGIAFAKLIELMQVFY